jgi:DNA-binding NarL/FixJ family response regulator
MTKTTKIRILIADDFKVLRDVISRYLEQAGDMEVIGEAPALDDALELTLKLQPDVIIMNDYLPPMNSAHATVFFRQKGISVPILAITMKIDSDVIQHAVRHGVNGFMHKDEMGDHLISAIRLIYRGERFFSPKVRESYGSIPK